MGTENNRKLKTTNPNNLYEITRIKNIEEIRMSIQANLDERKSQDERNKLGQFATPLSLSLEILRYAKEVMPANSGIRFLDPAFGTGSFYSALLQVFEHDRIQDAAGYEIDENYADEARRIWKGTLLKLWTADFTLQNSQEKANLVICNPPYVRHHHLTLSQKETLRKLVQDSTGIKLSGLAGLYCYYMLIAHKWMTNNGIAVWLVPSEFMDVNYGREVKKYLLEKVTLLRIHRFDTHDVQFSDADVSSAVIWFRNALPPTKHKVEFTFGATLRKPATSKLIPVEVLTETAKWTLYPTLDYDSILKRGMKLADFFTIKRGLATGANKFFILDKQKISHYKIPSEFLTPILPMPRDLATDEINTDEKGNPILDQQLFLLGCALPENEVKSKYPNLWQYLKTGLELGVDKRYLCKHKSPWYSQEDRPAAPFLCSYFGRRTNSRETPFRFILNYSKATASNSYLMLYPKPDLQKSLDTDPTLYRKVWKSLKEITTQELVTSGRVYGGGLHKLEPKELSNVPFELNY